MTLSSRQKNVQFPQKLDFWTIIVGIPLAAIFINLLLSWHLILGGNYLDFLKSYAFSLGFTTLYWLVFRKIFFYFLSKYPLETDNKKRRIRALGVQIPVFIFIQVASGLIFSMDYFQKYNNLHPDSLLQILSSLIFTVLATGFYENIWLTTQISHSIQEKETLKKENLASELAILKEQVNPHFLFNSLNTLSSLISLDAHRAEAFVDKLATVYRYILDKSNDELVTIDHEMQYLNSYIHLLKERFEDALIVTIDIDKSFMNTQLIIPLSMQMCIENCVKHNKVTRENPLSVSIFIQNDYLHISNKYQPLRSYIIPSGVGLQNIKQRYAYFTEKPMNIIQSEDVFTVCLPLIDVKYQKNYV